MEALLLLLIVGILNSALSYVDTALNALVPISLYAENYMGTLSGTNGFEAVFQIFFSFGIALIVLKFLKKGFDIYIIMSDGDGESDPMLLLKGFVKAIIIAVCFPTIYSWFAAIVTDLSSQLITTIGLSQNQDLAAMLTGISSAGIFTAIVSLIFFICFFMLYIQFLMKGLELLILRIGFPLACSGLMDADRGIFKTYIQRFIQALCAIVVQLALAKLGVALMINLHAFWGLAAIVLAIRTPKFLSEFLITTGGHSNMVSNVYQSVRLIQVAKSALK